MSQYTNKQTNKKKITLNYLIKYVLDLKKNEIDDTEDENMYALSTVKNELNDTAFNTLKYGETKSAGDFSKNIKKIFNPYISDMNRIGVIVTKGKDQNISLIYSILYCIQDNFVELSCSEKITCVEELNKYLEDELYSDNLFKKFNYRKLGWKKNELTSAIRDYKNNVMILQYISQLLCINIFLLNINDDKIYSIYPEEQYNVFKPSIMLTFFDGKFEPMIYKNNKIWKYCYDPLKKLINIDKNSISILNIDFSKDPVNKVFQIGIDDLSQYLNDNNTNNNDNNDDKSNDKNNDKNNDNNKNDNDEELNSENNYGELYVTENEKNEIFINDQEDTEYEIETAKNEEDIFCKKFSENSNSENLIQEISLRMKLKELQSLAKKFNINLVKGKTNKGKDKFKTKKELYDELILSIKNMD